MAALALAAQSAGTKILSIGPEGFHRVGRYTPYDGQIVARFSSSQETALEK